MTSLGPFEPLRSYLQMVSGLGEVTMARAAEAAESLVALGVSAVSTTSSGAQATSLAEEILEAARANRESLRALVRHEVERAVDLALNTPAPGLVRAGVAVLASQATRGLGGGSATSEANDPSMPRWPSETVPSPRDDGPPPGPVRIRPVDEGDPAPRPVKRATRAQASTAAKKATTAKKATAKTTTKTATAKKAATKATAAQKATTAKKATPAKTAATRTTKTATAKKATTKATPTKKATTAKKAAATRTTPATRAVRKAASATKAAAAAPVTPATTASTASAPVAGEAKD